LTGFRTYSEFVGETDPLERRLLVASVEAYQRKKEQAGPG